MVSLRLALLLLFSSCRRVASGVAFGGSNLRARRLEEGLDIDVALDLAKYSVKFDGCRANYLIADAEVEAEKPEIEVEVEEAAAAAEGQGPWQRRRLDQEPFDPSARGIVALRLCANENKTSSTTACDDACDDSEHGEIFMGMDAYLEAVVDWKREAQETYCEACYECSDEAMGGGRRLEEAPSEELNCDVIDLDECDNECHLIETMEENGYLDAAEFVECQRLDSAPPGLEIYVGAMCHNPQGGQSRIKIGVFLDEQCTLHDESKDVEDYLRRGDGSGNLYSMKLSYHLIKMTHGTNGCVATCLQEGDGQNFVYNADGEQIEIPEINRVCEELYYDSSLYSEYWNGDFASLFTPPPTVTSAPTPVSSPTVTSMSFSGETCVREGAGGTYFAGEFCEHPATAICRRGTLGAGPYVPRPQFCTNGGKCVAANPRVDDWTCDCAPGFRGEYCELVGTGGVDHDGADHDHHDADEDHGHGQDSWEVADQEHHGEPPFPFPADESLDYATRERNALEGLYVIAQGDRWTNNDGWLSNSSVCEWDGVSCDTGRSVSSLKLNGIGSFNNIYKILLRLANLTVLDLSDNDMFGVIPEEIGELRRLSHLKLGNNQLSRGVPKSLSTLPLRTLELQGNDLTHIQLNDGYESLEHLDLGDNFLTGTVQYDLSRLRHLQYVSLRGNNLVAGLANDYSLLANLTEFDISGNQITGEVPAGFSGNPELQYLNMSRNNLRGPINGDMMKAAFESSNEGPFVLDLSFNRLTGTVPNFDVDMLDLHVVGNMLTGIDLMACGREFWNDGATQAFECNGIACPNGTANSEGRQTSAENPCEQCNASFFFGTVGCNLDMYGAGEDGDAGYVSVEDDDAVYTIPPGDFFGEDGWAHDEDECPLYCLNGGVCVGASSPFQAEFWCRCAPGYMGKLCESSSQPSPPPFYMPMRPSFPVSSPGSSSGSSSYLQVVSPESLAKLDGYDHQVSLFGPPTFSGSANVYYASSELCDEMSEEYDNANLPWPTPFILMVDRGSCTFVTKVRNAQYAGALAVIVADNICLCDAGDSCALDPDEKCEPIWPILADDGSASDITIPAFLLLKQDADRIKEEVADGTDVVMELSLRQIPMRTERVEYQLWTTPTDIVSREFLLGFKESAQALRRHAYFTPRLFIFDGIQSDCTGVDGDNMCSDLCTNGGRYCATPPYDDDGMMITGASVVKESLRWICIWELSYGDGVGVQWWDYIAHFLEECANPEYFDSEECINSGLENAQIDPELITQCMEEHGGLEEDVENKLLEETLNLIQEQQISVVPTFRVNKNTISGTLNSANALDTICARLIEGSAPGCRLNTANRPTPPPSWYQPTPPPVSSSSGILPTPPPALDSFASDEEKYVEESTALSSAQPSIQPSLVSFSKYNVTLNSTTTSEPSSPKPSSVPSSQVTTPPSISIVSPEPTSTATDPDPGFAANSGQNAFPYWQFLFFLLPLVFL